MTNTCLMNAIDAINAFLVPVIALITTYIAWQQYKINTQKQRLDQRALALDEQNLRLNFYERRLRIFDETKAILRQAVQKRGIDPIQLRDFSFNVNESKFLFDSDITNFLSEFHKKAISADNTEQKLKSNDKGIIDDNNKAFEWLSDEYSKIESRFMHYLDFKKI